MSRKTLTIKGIVGGLALGLPFVGAIWWADANLSGWQFFLVVLVFLVLATLGEVYGSRKGTNGGGSSPGPLELISSEGIVVKECGPSGTVRIGGELWNAKSLSGSPIDVGETVIVRQVEGLLVLVERRDDK